jgi:hypothetical protein
MKPIGSQLAELNTICEQFHHENGTPESKSRIREIFSDLVKRGYQFVTLTFEPDSAEYEVLSDQGKRLCHRMHETRKKKMEAIHNEQFEKAADLRDLERNILQQVTLDFSAVTLNRFFVLLSEDSREIIFNDPSDQLKELFKSRN